MQSENTINRVILNFKPCAKVTRAPTTLYFLVDVQLLDLRQVENLVFIAQTAVMVVFSNHKEFLLQGSLATSSNNLRNPARVFHAFSFRVSASFTLNRRATHWTTTNMVLELSHSPSPSYTSDTPLSQETFPRALRDKCRARVLVFQKAPLLREAFQANMTLEPLLRSLGTNFHVLCRQKVTNTFMQSPDPSRKTE